MPWPGAAPEVDASQVIGNPLLTLGVSIITVTYVLAVAWMSYSIRRVTPELLQVRVFHKMRELHNSVRFMGLGLALGMALLTLFVSNLDLPEAAWGVAAAAAAIVFWYGTLEYSRVFHVPRRSARER